MSLLSLILAILAVIAVLLLAIFCYLQIYQKHINKALGSEAYTHKHMISPRKVAIILGGILITAAAVLALSFWASKGPLTSREMLEDDARKRAETRGMDVEIVFTDELAAILFYDGSRSDHSFEIYENKGIILENYVYSHGGSSTSIERSVRTFRYEGDQLILFSMNKLGIAKIVCHDGETCFVDPDLPFVLILPAGAMDFYDERGNLVNLGQDWWYEATDWSPV